MASFFKAEICTEGSVWTLSACCAKVYLGSVAPLNNWVCCIGFVGDIPRRLYKKGSRYRGLPTNLGPGLAIEKPTPVTCLSGGVTQESTGAESVRITDNIMYHRCESGGERVTLISILVFIVPDSTMMSVHLSVNVMLMDGYKHH
jgi:hypothetical protein